MDNFKTKDEFNGAIKVNQDQNNRMMRIEANEIRIREKRIIFSKIPTEYPVDMDKQFVVDLATDLGLDLDINKILLFLLEF